MDYTRLRDALVASLATLTQSASAYLPNLLGAALLALAGWLLARLARGSIRRLMDGLLNRLGRRGTSGAVQHTATAAISAGAFWIVLLVFWLAAFRVLNLTFLRELIAAIAAHLPHVLIALVILFASYVAGAIARSAIVRAARAADVDYGEALGTTIQAVILMVALVVSIDELGIQSRFLVVAAATALAATLGGAALAFGLGARAVVGNLLAAHYVQGAYRVGQTVRIGDVQGRILEINNSAVIIDVPEGRVHVPAKRFSEEVSMLVTEG